MTTHPRASDQTLIRERNLASILHHLWRSRTPLSRTDLVSLTGLTKSTVSVLAADLMSWHFVEENEGERRGPGRPSKLLRINPDLLGAVGVEIGVGFISTLLVDFDAGVRWKTTLPYGESEDKPAVLEAAMDETAGALALAKEMRLPVIGIGIGVPGLVQRGSGELLFAPNLGWKNVPIRDLWKDRFGLPTLVENEANMAAAGEHLRGVARGRRDVIFLSAGVGLGGGIILNGQLFTGMEGFAGEVGHMVLDPDGPPCQCGRRGCWETFVGPRAIVARVREALEPASAEFPGPGSIDMSNVRTAAEKGDVRVLDALREIGLYLGMGITNLVNIFNPELIVIGGALSTVGEFILPAAGEILSTQAIAPPARQVEITLSTFKFDACVMGAASVVLQSPLSHPTYWAERLEPASSTGMLDPWIEGHLSSSLHTV